MRTRRIGATVDEKKPLRQVKVLLLKDGLPSLESALKLDEHGGLPKKYPLAGHVPFVGAVYASPVSVKTPDWLPFLSEGMEAAPDIKTSTASAVLLLTSPAGHKFALTFGYGRYLVSPISYVRDFGIRVALNSLDPEQIRSVDMRRVEGLTVTTRRQASRASGLPTFGVNKRHDLIQSVAGLPEDETLGKRFEGSDAFTLATYVDFDDLGAKCDELYALYEADTYTKEFAFVDNLRVVREPERIAELDTKLEEALDADDLAKMHLAQPEAESLADINSYRYTARGPEHLELDAADMIAERRAAELPLTTEALSNQYVRVSYGHQPGHDLAKWPLYDCIVFETQDAEGNVFMLSAGVWHRASKEFVDEVNAQLATVPTCDIVFPNAYEGEHEGDYNIRAAQMLGCACTDRQNVRLPNQTPIELCDLMTDLGQLVHVKRKTQSATLSHLFNQGLVSAELLLQARPFREASRAVLVELDPEMAELVPLDGFDPATFEVVYAIVASPGTELPASLPLFSKITLAETSTLMQGMGYKVTTALVATQPQPPG